MAKDPDDDLRSARYEYRVWGRHKKARALLESMASETVFQQIDDCYFLLDDEPGLNAKIRDNTLKVKRLVGRRRGFERWASARHHVASSAPKPFDGLFEDLRLDRSARGRSYDLEKAVGRLDPDHPTTPVFVTKRRTRYRIGGVRAEVTEITIDDTGEVLHTIAIEGTDIDELTTLRKKLGLHNTKNVAVHVAIDDAR